MNPQREGQRKEQQFRDARVENMIASARCRVDVRDLRGLKMAREKFGGRVGGHLF